MSRGLHDPELVVGIPPFEGTNGALVVAPARVGAVGVLDLGCDPGRSLVRCRRHTSGIGNALVIRFSSAGAAVTVGDYTS